MNDPIEEAIVRLESNIVAIKVLTLSPDVARQLGQDWAIIKDGYRAAQEALSRPPVVIEAPAHEEALKQEEPLA